MVCPPIATNAPRVTGRSLPMDSLSVLLSLVPRPFSKVPLVVALAAPGMQGKWYMCLGSRLDVLRVRTTCGPMKSVMVLLAPGLVAVVMNILVRLGTASVPLDPMVQWLTSMVMRSVVLNVARVHFLPSIPMALPLVCPTSAPVCMLAILATARVLRGTQAMFSMSTVVLLTGEASPVAARLAHWGLGLKLDPAMSA